MPFALLGIPWLAGVLGGLFISLVAFFGQYMTKRLAIVLVVIVALVALTAAFFAAIQGLVAAIAYTMPTAVQTGMGLFLPSNAFTCMSAVMSAHVLRYVYAWNTRIIQYKMF